ncbi:hypothetical protein CDAR_297631 [Caerostris darwini]|uniref:Uncharacterized protein n=1 Tax=Caerostris darwini TaxID=1538125 RepID=A0AAV4PQD8_9ARAC|nr:hypothetical protein CDAR_297631 [Caerostris darwini]
MNQQSQERILISVIHGDYHLGEWNAIASAKDISQREQEMQRFCDYGPREIFALISAKGELITALPGSKVRNIRWKDTEK